jgi:hypothetical protein
MINVLGIVSYKFLPPKMGGQKCIAFFYNFLGKKLPFTTVTTKDNLVDDSYNFEVLNILGTSKLRYINLFYFSRIRKIVKAKQITHIIIEHPYLCWLGILLQRSCKVKLLIHSHNIEAIRFKSIGKWWWKLLWYYEKLAHRAADTNFFITDGDKAFAIKNYKLNPANCHTITYGIEMYEAPVPQQKTAAKETLQQLYSLSPADKIILFNGTLDYKPNVDAVDTILHNINPILLAQNDFSYKIIICGKGLPATYNELKDHQAKNIIYAGFVEDISIYFKGADIFINPVIDGGGIKTKLVEALGNNLSSVSTASGAIGIPKNITANKLLVIGNTDWTAFATAVLNIDTAGVVPVSFFEYFYWGNIADKAQKIMEATRVL